MDSTNNINVSGYTAGSSPDTTKVVQDPAAVQALLDQLRASQVWRDTLNSTSSHINSEQRAEVPESTPSTLEDIPGESRAQSPDIAPPASVASLLSQLRTSEWTSVAISTPPVSGSRTTHQPSQNISPPSQDLPTKPEHRTPRPDVATSFTHVQDIRSMSFQQALPRLTQLASDPGFLTAVSRVRFIHCAYSNKLLKPPSSCDKNKTSSSSSCGESGKLYIRNTRKKSKLLVPSKYVKFIVVSSFIAFNRDRAILIGAGLSKHEADVRG